MRCTSCAATTEAALVVLVPRGFRSATRPPTRSISGDLVGEPCFAVDAERGGASVLGESVALRQLYGVLSDEEFGVAGRALGMLAWDRDHRFCGRCGGPTERSAHERARTCEQCKHAAFPRLSPALIMLVEREGRALLARNARFPGSLFSTLAGFRT